MADEPEARPVDGSTYLPLVAQLEKSGDDAISPAGAIGKYQIMPGTARQYGFEPEKLTDPKYNEQAATAILNDLHQRFNGDVPAVLAAYNAGPTAARRWIAGGRDPNALPAETQGYLSRASQLMTGGNLPTEPHQITVTNATPNLPPEAPALSAGQKMIQRLQESGQFTDQQISEFYGRQSSRLMDAGFKPNEIQDFWGERKPNQSIINAYVERNLRAAGDNGDQKIASSPTEAFGAGFDMSVTHLKNADTLPNTVVPADAPIFNKIMEFSGQTLGDFPYMVAGGIGGAAVGEKFGGTPGAIIGAGAGAASLPAAMREIYLDHLRMREISTPSDFLGMAGKSVLNVGEQTLAGGASALVGGKAGATAIKLGANKIAGGVANTLTNAATYTGLSSAFQGKMPSWQDGIAMAVTALGIHGAAEVAGRIVPTPAAKDMAANSEKIYAETGMTPGEQAQKASNDRVVAQEMMARDVTGEPVIPNLRLQAPEEPKPYQEIEPVAARGEGGAPPKEPPEGEVIPPEPDNAQKIEGRTLTEDELNEKASEFIGEAKPDPWWKKLVPDFSKFYNTWISELGPARHIDDLLIGRGKYNRDRQLGIEDMFRQTYASTNRSSYMISRGGIDALSLSRRDDVPAPRDAAVAVQKDGGNVDGWVNYMVAKRANDLEARGLETGHPLSLDERNALIKFGDAKYERGSEIWNRAMDGVLEYGRDSGLFSQEAVNAMKRDNPMYVSLRRIMGEELPPPKAGGRGFKVRQPVKTYEGDDSRIVNPFLASLDNIRAIVQMADRNRAIGALVNLAETHGIDPADIGVKQIKYDPKATIAEPGSDIFKPYDIADPKPYEAFLAQRAMRKSSSPDQFMYIRDGKPEFWKAADPQLASLVRGAESPGEMGIIGKTLNAFAKIQRSGITLPIDFPLRILALRHPITAAIFDPLHPTPFYTMMKGVADVLTESDAWHDWAIKGGAGASIVELDRDVVQKDIQNVFQETGTWGKLWNTVKPGNWVAASQLVMGKLDAMARVAYTKQAVEKFGIDPIKAATMSRKAMMDYSEKATGVMAQRMASNVPFFRPDLLGLKMAAEGTANDPWGMTKHAILNVTIPSAVLYGLNYLQDEYGNLPEDQKYKNMDRMTRDLNYVLPSVGGFRIRIPYPFQAGAPFGALINRFLDHFRDSDLDAFDKWAKSIVGQYIPNMVPGYVQAPMEWWANKNWSTGHPLMPGSLEGASGPMQYTPYTTEASKKLSQFAFNLGANISPINLDRITQDLGGTLGYAILKAGNYALRPDDPRPMQMADMPFIGSFLARTPGMNAAPIQEFLDKRAELQEKLKDKSVAISRIKTRDATGMQQYQDAIQQITVQVAQAEATGKALRVLMSAIDGVNNDPLKSTDEIAKMSITERSETHAKTVDDKRQLIDQYTGLMIGLARSQLGAWKGTRAPEDVTQQYQNIGRTLNDQQ